MYLSLFEQIKQLSISEFELFERAYEHAHGTVGYVIPEYCTFVQLAVLPQYVIDYLLYLRSTS
jgi:hypothetical protein